MKSLYYTKRELVVIKAGSLDLAGKKIRMRNDTPTTNIFTDY